MNDVTNFNLDIKEFRVMNSPFESGSSKDIIRYIMFADIKSLESDLKNWFDTNPRCQNIKQSVSKDIKNTLLENPSNFHNLNKGILFSAKDVSYDNMNGRINFSFEDPNIHGNIDGGHTLRVISEYKEYMKEKGYVFVEIIVGIKTRKQIAILTGARNKTLQVDLQSLANLEKKFDCVKEVFEKKDISFRNRIIYKTNEDKIENDALRIKDIKIRDLIAILNMFNLDLYSNSVPLNNLKKQAHPLISYSSKKKALEIFLSLDKERNVNFSSLSQSINESVLKMENIIKDIFDLYDQIESDFSDAFTSSGKKYDKQAYAIVKENRTSKFNKRDLSKVPEVPEGLLYPLLGAFRVLVYHDKFTDKFAWRYNPLDFWKEEKNFLVGTIANFIEDNKEFSKPDALGKSRTLWQILFDKILIVISDIEKRKRLDGKKNVFPSW